MIAASHNGGRSQINFNFPSNGGEWWSVNLFKMYGRPQWTGTSMSPTDLDADGYPLANPSGKGFQWIGFLPGQDRRPGTLVMTWSGNGVMSLTGSGVTGTGGSLTSSGGAGRYEFTLSITGQINVGISSWTSKITNVAIFFKDEETSGNLTASYFGTDFKSKLRAAKIGVYRFLNWQEGNSSNCTKWAHRKSPTFSTWGAADIRPELYCGSATGTNDYSISGNVGNGAAVPGIIPTTGGPADKMVVSYLVVNAMTFDKTTGITFDNVNGRVNWTAHGTSVGDPVMFGLNASNASFPVEVNSYDAFYVKTVVDVDTIEICRMAAGNPKVTFATAGTNPNFTAQRMPTLTLNSGTKYPIKSKNCQILGTTGKFAANTYYVSWFDDTQKSWIASDPGYAGFINVVPYEVCIALCQEMGAHPWFCNLAPTCYPLTDFIGSLATLLKAAQGQTPWMIPRLETIPNELWNATAPPVNIAASQAFAIAFTQSNPSWGSGSSPGANFHAWCGMVNSLAGQAINSAFGGTVGGPSGLYQSISGVQSAAFTSATSTHNERMTSALYISTFGKSTADAGKNWITHNAIAMYFRPNTYYGSGSETTWANAYVASGDVSNIPTYVDDILTGSAYLSLTGIKNTYTNVAAWGAGYSTKDGYTIKMCGYEGGWSPDYGSRGNSNVDKFRAATKSYIKLYDYTRQTYADFVAAGGEFPTCFQMGGTSPSQYAWSVLEDLYQSPEPPQWTAIRHFNNGLRRLRW